MDFSVKNIGFSIPRHSIWQMVLASFWKRKRLYSVLK